MHGTTCRFWYLPLNSYWWCTKGMHARWCTKQLLMDATNEELPIPDDEQKNCWWMREIKDSMLDDVWYNCKWMIPMKDYPYQMMYKATVDGRDRRRMPFQMIHDTPVDGWDRWKNPYQMMHETTGDEWDQQMTTHTKYVQNNCWWTRHMMESIPVDTRNNSWRMRPL